MEQLIHLAQTSGRSLGLSYTRALYYTADSHPFLVFHGEYSLSVDSNNIWNLSLDKAVK